MSKKIKKNDYVLIITGKHKGIKSKVIKIISKKYAIVEGVNLVKKHIKPTLNKKGSILIKESKIDISNLSIINNITKKI